MEEQISLSSLIAEPRLKLRAVPFRSGEDPQQITGSQTNKSQSGDDGNTYRLASTSEKQDVTSWCLNPVQILFGVRASWLLPEEQQAQTAKRPTKDKHIDLIVRLRMHHDLRGGMWKRSCEHTACMRGIFSGRVESSRHRDGNNLSNRRQMVDLLPPVSTGTLPRSRQLETNDDSWWGLIFFFFFFF